MSRKVQVRDKNKNDDICPKCSVAVTDSDSALECEICQMWYHIKCQKLTESEYNFIGDHKSVHWYCTLCNKNIASLLQMFGNLKQRQDKIEESFGALQKEVVNVVSEVKSLNEKSSSTDKKLDDFIEGGLTESILKSVDSKIEYMANKIKAEIGSLSQEVKAVKELSSSNEIKLENAIEAKLVEGLTKTFETKFDDKVKSIKQDLVPTFSEVVAKHVDSKFVEVSEDLSKVKVVLGETKKMAEEEKNKESRSHNIIIYRAEETSGTRDERQSYDKAFCLDLFKKLDVDVKNENVKSVFRIGKIEGSHNPRPILVQFRERIYKNQVIESLSKLKLAEEKFKKLSITHDMTPEERTECKKLVEEAKKKQSEEQGEYFWRVRGSPGQMKLIRLQKH